VIDATSTSVATAHGLTLTDLVVLTGHDRHVLRAVLTSEMAAGRVVRDEDGRYSVIPDAFDAATLAALKGLDFGGEVYAAPTGRPPPNASAFQKRCSRARTSVSWAGSGERST
jgi:hypothetical protein